MPSLSANVILQLMRFIEQILVNHPVGRTLIREIATKYSDLPHEFDWSAAPDALAADLVDYLVKSIRSETRAESLLLVLGDLRQQYDHTHQTAFDEIAASVQYHINQSKRRQVRRLDAAMPAECHVNVPTEVRVLIALPGSMGLKVYLPDFTESGDIITKHDVVNSNVYVLFATDPKSGELLPAHLWIRIVAAGFEIVEGIQGIQVLPDSDSGMFTFILTPRQPEPKGRVLVGIYLDSRLDIQLLGVRS